MKAGSKAPDGFKVKAITVTVRQICRPASYGSIDFLIPGHHRDDYMRDEIGSVSRSDLVEEMNLFFGSGYTAAEVADVYHQVGSSPPFTRIDLPKPVKVKLSLFKRKW